MSLRESHLLPICVRINELTCSYPLGDNVTIEGLPNAQLCCSKVQAMVAFIGLPESISTRGVHISKLLLILPFG